MYSQSLVHLYSFQLKSLLRRREMCQVDLIIQAKRIIRQIDINIIIKATGMEKFYLEWRKLFLFVIKVARVAMLQMNKLVASIFSQTLI